MSNVNLQVNNFEIPSPILLDVSNNQSPIENQRQRPTRGNTLGGRSSNSGRDSQRSLRRRNALYIESFEDLVNQVQPINYRNTRANYIHEEALSTDDEDTYNSE